MRSIKIWNDDPSPQQVAEIVSLLEEGAVMLTPTDTLYGIACDALNQRSIERICRQKGINPDKTNLSILCSDIAMVSKYAQYDNYAFRLLKDYTPGAVTFLFRAARTLPKAFKGRKVVGVRIPANETVRRVVAMLDRPLLTTSIEYDDMDYAINPSLIAEANEHNADFMVEGEDGRIEPSTIVDCTGHEPVVVRQGAVDLDI